MPFIILLAVDEVVATGYFLLEHGRAEKSL